MKYLIHSMFGQSTLPQKSSAFLPETFKDLACNDDEDHDSSGSSSGRSEGPPERAPEMEEAPKTDNNTKNQDQQPPD